MKIERVEKKNQKGFYFENKAKVSTIKNKLLLFLLQIPLIRKACADGSIDDLLSNSQDLTLTGAMPVTTDVNNYLETSSKVLKCASLISIVVTTIIYFKNKAGNEKEFEEQKDTATEYKRKFKTSLIITIIILLLCIFVSFTATLIN